MKVSIIGVTGYSGVELLRILHSHPVFDIHSIHSTKVDRSISEEYPHMLHIIDKKVEDIDFDRIGEESDVVFLATPSGISKRLVEQLIDKDIKIIDLSGDLRLKDSSEYIQWYKKDPVKNSILTESVYGLSEWNEESIQSAKWIANPGCYPTATLLGLAPVIIEQFVEPASIIVDAKSGTSGAGKTPSNGTLYTEVNENLKIYKVNEHQHTPEIEQQLRMWNGEIKPITFSTHLLPVTRGIMTTIYVQLIEDLDTDKLIDLYKNTYEKHPFVRIRPKGTFPAIKEVCSTNYCDIGLHVDKRTGRLTIVSVIDNLMKGAAGQAVQNANIMFGLDQQTGLNFSPLYP
ncbi:N-acetyl-gamma-glutamyl-phosphate reductase [Bacillus sp. 31A1R]|uniref:N-acetyl-gamma-glutamyl-phosphate reductase n=1 Tax=Robertmurraya mangrovi TaxID=3098077 RepID=A0ABU5IT42_9BACI|nr:N-acetyl-gamma-glutamyl-phosphate reductase [Bacillus sp. 31A1R]MDZ5470319.1 N-acetyl-gamma-glutamyl-phosphate reductase [Bacillus sp. 31A1R]